MNYYISDLHFGHKNIIRLDGRPYSSVEENDEALISSWNSTVKPDDDIWIIGDFAWKNADTYLDRLVGKKHLILGNHDKLTDSARKKFESVDQMKMIWDTLDGQNVSIHMCHYPMAEWNGYFRGTYHVYGHIHNNKENMAYKIMSQFDKALNAGCMINDYRPVTLKELIVNNKKFKRS